MDSPYDDKLAIDRHVWQYSSELLKHGQLAMGLSQEIQRRIRNKESEIASIEKQLLDLRVKLEAGKAYIQGLQDILPKAERESEAMGGVKSSSDLRPGTLLAQARDALLASGKPLHIGDLLIAMGKENTQKNRLSLGGSLARSVRENVVFSRPAPNTFGLLAQAEPQKQGEQEEELPEGFGK